LQLSWPLHALPHRPQFRGSVCRLEQFPPPQSVCPFVQPLQRPFAQVSPAAQSAFVMQATQRLAVVSQ
jgi:hypothetical protein